MSKQFVTILGKSVQAVAKLRGGGSALPGLVVERIDPDFIRHALSSLPRGVVVISGTNGKTTTTKMVVELLESQGLNVFTNKTGSNFTRGVAAALLSEVDRMGVLHADIAVLELDEAHAVHFVRVVPPTYSLLLNVMRDQLDRFGEIDATRSLLETIALATTDTIVLNREDTRIASIADNLSNKQHITFFGLDASLLGMFPGDDALHGEPQVSSRRHADVTLLSLKGKNATFQIGDKKVPTSLALNGIYNVYNAAAALALVRAILGTAYDEPTLMTALSKVTPAFGRGETILVDGQPVELVLVKNPSGFRLGLESFNATGYATMIAINDNYADGRDMSWLWDVDFSSLRTGGVDMVTGIRAYDIALRLQYDDVPLEDVEIRQDVALKKFLRDHADSPKRIYCTYTAMLRLRKRLLKLARVEPIS